MVFSLSNVFSDTDEISNFKAGNFSSIYLWYVVQYFSWYSDEMTGHISEIL